MASRIVGKIFIKYAEKPLIHVDACLKNKSLDSAYITESPGAIQDEVLPET